MRIRWTGVNVKSGPTQWLISSSHHAVSMPMPAPRAKNGTSGNTSLLPRQPAVLPPEDHQHPAGQRCRDRLAHQRQQEESQGTQATQVKLRGPVEAEVAHSCPQIEDGRERIS